ncbi:MAG: hypothetical protein JWN28_9 [Candidatus Saccharibacteria bacterium]|nr:hypothetical protein [Candidatus Saccharibacteria bacterium]
MLKKVLFGAALSIAVLFMGQSSSVSAVANTNCNNNTNAITYTRNANLSEVTVTLKQNYTACDVSLNSYSTDGANWATSGTQVLKEHATAHLTAEKPTATLKIAIGACFIQNDLYFGTTRFDGVDGALPHYPNSVTPKNLIAYYNGGKACTQTPAKPAATVTTTCGAAEVNVRNDFTPAAYTYGEDATVSIFVDGKLDKDVVVVAGTVAAPVKYSFAEDSGNHMVSVQYKGTVLAEGTVTTDCAAEEPQGNGAVMALPETSGNDTAATVITLAAITAAIAGASLVARRVLSRRI